MVRLLFRPRQLLALAFLLAVICRVGPRQWLTHQNPWEWAILAAMLAIFAALF